MRKASMLRMVAGMAAGISATAFLGVIGVATPAAAAQEQDQQRQVRQGDGPREGGPRRMMRGGPRRDRAFGGPRAERPPVTADELTSYAEILQLDANQRDVVAQMHAELMDTIAKLQGERETKLDEIRQQFQEKQDPSVFMEELPKFMELMRERRDTAEKTFFDDLQLLLTGEQEAYWPKMERTRRRERTLSPGMVPGDAVDLIAVSKELGFAKRDGVPPLLETYEVELDEKLQARNKAQAFDDGPGGSVRMFRMLDRAGEEDAEETIAEQFEKMRDAAFALRDLNQKYARLLGENLTTDEREALAAKVHEASFPQVYRENRTRRAFDMVLGMDDLDADQRARINALFDDFNKQASALNKNWADALEKDAQSGGSGGRMSFTTEGGAQIEIAGAGGEESEASQARQARRDLDNKMYESLRGILRPEQQERLPQRRAREFGGAGGNVVFMSEEVIEGEDGSVGQRMMVVEVDGDGEGVGEDVEINVHAVGDEDGEGMVIIHEEETTSEGGEPSDEDGDGG